MLTPTRANFEASDWEAALSSVAQRTCFNYVIPLGKQADAAVAAGDADRGAVFLLLAQIASLSFRPAESDALKVPIEAGPLARHFDPQAIATIREVSPNVKDPEMRARLADFSWLTARDHKLARLAIEAYLASAAVLEDHAQWTHAFDRIQRASHLEGLLSKRTIPLTAAHICRILADSDNVAEPSFFVAKLLSLLVERNQSDVAAHGALAERHARKSEAKRQWPMAYEYWTLAAVLRGRGGSDEERDRNLALAAETFVHEAEDGAARGPGVAAFFIERAIQAYRRMGKSKPLERIAELQRIMLDYQRKLAEQLVQVASDPIDLSEVATRAEAAVRGKPFAEALLSLCGFCPPPSVVKLREAVHKTANQFVYKRLFGTRLMTSTGKTIEQKNPISGDPEQDEQAILHEMFEEAATHRELNARGIIEPAQRAIWEEHPVTVDSFIPFLVANPFVPQGRETLYAKGLLAGMSGDYGVALHLLMPQVENSLREVFGQHGIITSKLDANGIQDEKSLTELLDREEGVREFLGDDLHFEACGLLIERFGSNLRNLTAHGLMGIHECYGPQAAYFWWWTLRFVCAPYRVRVGPTGSDADGGTDPA